MAGLGHMGPGVVKVRHPRPQTTRVASLTRADDGLWAQLFRRADIVSEGATDHEDEGVVYRGSTSILLQGVGQLMHAAEVDPHLRLRALRMARREAQVRAPGLLDVARMDMIVRLVGSVVRIDVDVEARVEQPAVEPNAL